MTCAKAVEILLSYLEGDLPPQTEAALEDHLGGCTPCRDYLTTYTRTIEYTRQAMTAPDGPAAEALPESLVQVLLRAQRSREESDAPASATRGG